MKIIININKSHSQKLNEMINCRNFWPGNVPPHSVEELVHWAIEDYIDWFTAMKGSD